jgi:hypothetical protein
LSLQAISASDDESRRGGGADVREYYTSPGLSPGTSTAPAAAVDVAAATKRSEKSAAIVVGVVGVGEYEGAGRWRLRVELRRELFAAALIVSNVKRRQKIKRYSCSLSQEIGGPPCSA